MNFDELIRRMRESVLASEQGHLLLGWRLRLWRRMQLTFPDSSFRRNVLLYTVVADMLRYWGSDALIPEFDEPWRDEYIALPPRIVALMKSSLSIEAPLSEEVREACARLDGYYDYANDGFKDFLTGYAAIAIGAVYWRVRDVDDTIYTDADWYADIEDDARLVTIDDLTAVGDRDTFDSHFWAAELAAHEPSGGRTEDAEARRRFWLQWLDNRLPRVLGTTEDAKNCIA